MNPADLLNDDGPVYASQLERRASFEESVTKFILGRHQLKPGPLLQDLKRKTSNHNAKLSLGWFFRTFDFPVLLGVGRTLSISDIDLGHLLKEGGFRKTFLFRDYVEMSHALRDGQNPLGMVFRYPRVANYVILHDVPVGADVSTPHVICPIGGSCPANYVLERFDLFLDRLNWEPPESC